MADYTVTVANVIPSAYAIYLSASPPFKLMGEPPTPSPNMTMAGAFLTAGVPVYVGSDGLIYPADADGVDPLYKCIGIAVNAALAGQPVAVVIKDPNFQPGFTMLVGDSLIVSGNVGRIAPDADKASGWKVTSLGAAYSTTKINLNPTRTDVAKA